VRRALIIGVNDIGIAVARLLVGNGYEVAMIARSEDEGKLGKKVPAYVYVGEPTKEDFLSEVGIDRAELVLSLIDDDTNIRVAEIARARGVPLVILLIHDKDKYLDRAIELGAMAVSISDAVLSKIANYIRPQFKQLLYSDENVQMYYVIISSESPYIGQSIKDIGDKCGVSIPVVVRNNEVIITEPELKLEPGDKILVVGNADSVVKCVERLY